MSLKFNDTHRRAVPAREGDPLLLIRGRILSNYLTNCRPRARGRPFDFAKIFAKSICLSPRARATHPVCKIADAYRRGDPDPIKQ